MEEEQRELPELGAIGKREKSFSFNEEVEMRMSSWKILGKALITEELMKELPNALSYCLTTPWLLLFQGP